MTSYISLLRGINVSGQKKIRMEDLKKLYESLEFSEVRTYIQSGNVILKSTKTSISRLSETISKKISESFGYDVVVLIRTKEEIRKIIENTPFRDKDNGKVGVTFLSEIPLQLPTDEIYKVKDNKEEFVISGKEIYLYLPNGFGRTKLTNNFLERKLKVPATTRNWKTVNKLLEIAEGL